MLHAAFCLAAFKCRYCAESPMITFLVYHSSSLSPVQVNGTPLEVGSDNIPVYAYVPAVSSYQIG